MGRCKSFPSSQRVRLLTDPRFSFLAPIDFARGLTQGGRQAEVSTRATVGGAAQRPRGSACPGAMALAVSPSERYSHETRIALVFLLHHSATDSPVGPR